jgi:hypothetical protein
MSEMGGWISLLCMDKVRELGGVSQEESRWVVGNLVPVAFVRLELHREASRITSTIMRSRFATDCGESNSDRALFAWLEHICETQILQAIRGLVDTMSPTTFGMNDSLWDTPAIEM